MINIKRKNQRKHRQLLKIEDENYKKENEIDYNPVKQNGVVENRRNLSVGETCDGCYDGDATCFCVNCEKIYCKVCEDQIHVVSVNRNDEKYLNN